MTFIPVRDKGPGLPLLSSDGSVEVAVGVTEPEIGNGNNTDFAGSLLVSPIAGIGPAAQGGTKQMAITENVQKLVQQRAALYRF